MRPNTKRLPAAAWSMSKFEMLQDLIMAAVNEALRKGEEAREAAMSRMAPGMGGLF